jgi:bacterioferritin-associated ferredoxin
VLICHCHAVSDRTIRESIRDGARSADEVGAMCRAGTCCGGCRPGIEALLRQACCDEDAAEACAPQQQVVVIHRKAA